MQFLITIIMAALLLSVSFAYAAAPAAPVTVKTELAHSRVLSGLEIQVQTNQLTVLPGVCRVGDATVQVAAPASFTIDPAAQITVADEEYDLTTDPPDRWLKGTHLKGCLAPSGTALPGCLVPGS